MGRRFVHPGSACLAAAALLANSASAQTRPGPDLRAVVTAAAEIINGRAPIDTGNGGTITGARANRLELIISMTVSGAITEPAVAALRRTLPTVQCRQPGTPDLIRRGVRFTYRVSGTSGRPATITIDRCPAPGA